MKIDVVSRHYFLDIKGKKKEREILKNHAVISINTPKMKNWVEETPPFSSTFLFSKDILILNFHDYYTRYEGVQLMTMWDFYRIKRFCDVRLDKDFIVHCTAGISRSYTVSYCLNIYYNRMVMRNDKDFFQFIDKYQKRGKINPWVQEMIL